MPSSSTVAAWVSALAASAAIVPAALALVQGCDNSTKTAQANRIATEANRIAKEARQDGKDQHRENLEFQRDIKNLDIWLAAPNLECLQCIPTVDGRRLVATVQNNGVRDAALLAIAVEQIDPGTKTGSVQGGGQGAAGALEPLAETVRADLIARSPYQFWPPRIVKAGSVVNIEVAVPGPPSAGGIVLRYGKQRTLWLGSYRWPQQATGSVESPTAPHANAAEMPADPFSDPPPAPAAEPAVPPTEDDLFGAPPPPNSQGPPQAPAAPALPASAR